MLLTGALIAALLAAIVGIFGYTSIPTELGFWRFVGTQVPMLTGMTPAFHHGIDWKYTWEEFDQVDLSGKTALVTGANSGIGYDLAAALAKGGAHVVMVCRSESKCAAAKATIEEAHPNKRIRITTSIMDTASLASTRAFCETYIQTQQPSIDMIYMNAGANYLTAPGEDKQCGKKTKADGIDYLFQVNYLSHHLLYQLLKPVIADNASIVHTSSASSFTSFSYKVATDSKTLHGCSEKLFDRMTNNLSYGQSKLAQILWVKALTRRNDSIVANAFHPGLVNTAIIGKVMDTAGPASSTTRSLFDGLANSAWQSPHGALTGLYLGVSSGIRGRYYHPQAQEVVNPLSLDEKLQDDLWAFSDELVKDYLTPIEMLQVIEEEPIVEEPVVEEQETPPQEAEPTTDEGAPEEVDNPENPETVQAAQE